MELSPHGHQQAATLAKHVRHICFDAIYASPMKRAQQTLAPLLADRRAAADTLAGLREVDFGDWTGLSWEQVRAKYSISAFEWLDQLERATIPNAESAEVFRARVEPCLRQILRDHPGQSVAILCHGGTIRMMLSILLALPLPKMAGFEIEYASVTQVHCSPHKTEVQLLNFAPWRDAR